MTVSHGTQAYSGVRPHARSTMRGTASVRQVSQTRGSSTRVMSGSSRSMRMTHAAIALAVKHASFTQLRRAHSRSSASRGRLAMLSRNEADEPVPSSLCPAPPPGAEAERSPPSLPLERFDGCGKDRDFLAALPSAALPSSTSPRMAMAAANVRRRMRMCARSLMSSTLSVVHGLPAASSTSAASSIDTASNPQPNDCRNTASSCGWPATKCAIPTSRLSRHPRMRTLQVRVRARRIGCREARHAQHGKSQLGELAIDAVQ